MLNSIFAAQTGFLQITLMLTCSFAIGVLLSMIFGYKNSQSKSFAVTLALLPMVSSVIIFMVNDHLGLSVAVAGAFTLVRFRSIAGTGRELLAIFSAMMLGLVLGMGYLVLSGIIFVFLSLAVLLLQLSNFGTGKEEKSVLITIPEDLDYEGIFDDIFKKYAKEYKLTKVRTKNMGSLFEISYNAIFTAPVIPKAFIDEIRTRNGNLPVSITEKSAVEEI